MLRPRVIPVLLLKGGGLYKTVRFREPRYVGDPLNTMRIFNEKEVDEICVLDIGATVHKRRPDVDLIRQIAGEAFMPLAYGGGISSLDQARQILKAGVEKVVLNALATENPEEVRRIAAFAGSSSVVVSIDVSKHWLRGYQVMSRSASQRTALSPVEAARRAEQMGAGEILLTAVDRDGTMAGYDLNLIRQVAEAVSVPVIACGGAGGLADLGRAMAAGASAASAGSLFVFQGRHRAVLITYPSPTEIESLAGAAS